MKASRSIPLKRLQRSPLLKTTALLQALLLVSPSWADNSKLQISSTTQSSSVTTVAALNFPNINPATGRNTDPGQTRGSNNYIGSLNSANSKAPRPKLAAIPMFKTIRDGKFVASYGSNKQQLTLSPKVDLQNYAQTIIDKIKAPHSALVALDPQNGKILAIAGKSRGIKEVATHNLFPAASLFKIVTAAAAYYTRNVTGNSVVSFRGGNYTLNKYNYLPNTKSDRRKMSVSEAMGKSCNPVFGRLALQLPSPAVLRDFAMMFQFGTVLQSDLSIPQSEAFIPNDPYNLSLTGAGFGEVTISPIHAASLVGAIANQGILSPPQIIENIINADGSKQNLPTRPLKRIIDPEIATVLSEMMLQTTKTGTGRRAFLPRKNQPKLSFDIIAKTGTLSGDNPKGLTRWFIAAAPAKNPQIAIATVVVDARYQSEFPAYISRDMLVKFFNPKN
jgi:cell division protein FtsI/penicillin-binding protein 2